MALPLPKPLNIALLVAVPLVLFLVVREQASWRPHKVTGLRYGGAITISPDERFVASTAIDDTGPVSVRDLTTGKEVRHHAFGHIVSVLAFSPDGRELAVAWSKSSTSEPPPQRLGVEIWNFDGKKRQFERLKDEFQFEHATQIRYSPDGKTLWLASTDNLRSWNVASGRLTWQWRQGEMGRDSSLPYFSSLSQDCQFYCRSDGEGYSVWDTRSRKRIVHTKLPSLYDEDLLFSPDGLYATYWADDPKGSYHVVIDATNGGVLWRSQQEPCLRGGKAITIPRDEASYEVRDIRTGKFLYRLPAVPGAVPVNSFSPIPGNRPVNSASSDWLYSVSRQGELFRQRLR